MQTKAISEMNDDEIRAEIERLQALKVPSERKAKAPPRKKDSKPRKASWRDKLFE